VAARTADLHTVIERLADRRGGPIHAPRADAWKARALAYHAPCHLRAAGRGDQPRRLLEKLLGLEFAVSNATCCGMGGTYGIKAVHAEMSKAIAQETLERLRGSGAEIIVTSCGMCRTQLAAATGLKVLHPMEILADALRPTTQPMQNAE
jgi:glycerol-3-phosphate dehydrogenase subunit C